MTPLFFEHLRNTSEYLRQFSHSVIGQAEHKTNIGSAREALISNFLVRNLPSAIEYPSGELFDAEDHRSGQIDIILLPRSFPKLHLFAAITLAPVDSVLGSVEVKSNLTTGGKEAELTRVLNHCRKLKALKRGADRTIKVPFLSHDGEFRTCPYILFAYKGAHPDTVLAHLEEAKSEFDLESMPDLIVVLEPEYVLAKQSTWMYAGATAETVYRRGDSKQPALFYLYAFVLGLVEFWGENPSLFTLPLNRYVEKQASLSDFFED